MTSSSTQPTLMLRTEEIETLRNENKKLKTQVRMHVVVSTISCIAMAISLLLSCL